MHIHMNGVARGLALKKRGLRQLGNGYTRDSEDEFRSGSQNVCHCQQQQFFSELHSPGRSQTTD